MIYDTESPPGSWRQEILKTAASPSQLRELIAELEHLLRVARAERDALSETNKSLVIQLSKSVATEMELRGKYFRLKDGVHRLWKLLTPN